MRTSTAKEMERRWTSATGHFSARTRLLLRSVLDDLADESDAHSLHAWQQRKAPMALYHRAVTTHVRRIERAVRRAVRRDDVRAAESSMRAQLSRHE